MDEVICDGIKLFLNQNLVVAGVRMTDCDNNVLIQNNILKVSLSCVTY